MGTAGRYDFYHFALTGGCTGSTSGSVKIFRWQVVWAYLKQSMIVATEPNRVVPIKIGNLTTSNSIISSVFVFISAFMATLVVLTVLVAWTGLDFRRLSAPWLPALPIRGRVSVRLSGLPERLRRCPTLPNICFLWQCCSVDWRF